MCWLARHKARVRIPGQASIRKMEKNLRLFLLSRYLAKSLKLNKPVMKKFLKNLSFGVDVKL